MKVIDSVQEMYKVSLWHPRRIHSSRMLTARFSGRLSCTHAPPPHPCRAQPSLATHAPLPNTPLCHACHPFTMHASLCHASPFHHASIHALLCHACSPCHTCPPPPDRMTETETILKLLPCPKLFLRALINDN